MKKKAVVSVINDLVTDQRVNKTCMLLSEMGWEVLLIGRKLKNSPVMDKRPYKYIRMKLIFESGPLFYLEYQLRLFLILLFKNYQIYFSNDLDTLLPNYIKAKLSGKPVIYDAHEYFTGVPELQAHPNKKKIWKMLEKRLLPGVNELITVNKSIASLYKKEYGLSSIIIRNIPPLQEIKSPGRVELGLPANMNIIILQGSGINVNRGAEEMVEAMQYINNTLLLIIGGGDVINNLKIMVKELHLEEKVLFKSRLPYQTMMQYTSVADLGLSLDKPSNLNYLYSLPNKLFDYLHAGTPVLATPLPEIKKIIEKYRVGTFIANHDPECIAETVNKIFSKPEKIKKWKANTQQVRKELNWEVESEKLIKLFNKYE